ncbi:Histidine--tRNA ligase [Dendrobium catenatum]|uniref:Histidine--tRNA ligase n=1 Tax=Dendrobium catenatum TaxID=906689 RepID=A0A2I0VT54_9ASPA|nr:Histidine--tRNA ligase [Dendrobium catenatum]
MELAGGERPTIVIGGKGSSLSSADVYAVARGFRKVAIDPAALERFSRSQSPPPHPAAVESISKFLTSAESRAALVVLINKLVVSDGAVWPIFLSLIGEILGLQSGHSSLDFGSTGGLVTSLFKLNGKHPVCHPDEFVGATKDEISLLEKSAAASVGICAMLDCCASALVKLSDAVAAFSCEAARADVVLFDLPPSGDVFSIKYETDVAADIKAFLFGSNTVGRGAVRALHGRTGVELNSSINVRKNAVGVVSRWKEDALVALVLPLAMSIQSMCELSLGREMTVATFLGNEEKRKKFMEDFNKGCPSLDVMREGLCLISKKAASGSDYVEVLHGVYELLVILKEILVWEAEIALYALELDDSIEKQEVNDPACINVNTENEKVEKKVEKKKRKKTLGRGTSILWKVFKDMLNSQNDASIDNVATFGIGQSCLHCILILRKRSLIHF